MTVAARKKRSQIYWWMLANQPLCPRCNVPCRVYATKTIDGGKRQKQYRKCPKCGHAMQRSMPK